MSEQLQQFVHGALDAMGAKRMEMGKGSGVWRAEVPDSAARFLGRSHRDLIYTFDLDRWEEGTRLECLTRHSPLVERLLAFAQARGGVAVAYVRDSDPGATYQPYIVARFHSRINAGAARTQALWIGMNLSSEAPVKLKGDPLGSPDLVEGLPPGAVMPAGELIDLGIAKLTVQWNRAVAQDTRELQAALERRYRQEAAEIGAAKQGAERERLLKRLHDRMLIETECRLDMALMLWLAAR